MKELREEMFFNVKSPFLRLPPEIRNRIYEFVLGGRLLLLSPPELRDGYPVNSLALLLVCRQIHQETRDLPFTLNRFTVKHPHERGVNAYDCRERLLDFAMSLSERQRKSVNSLTMPRWHMKLVTRWSFEISRPVIDSFDPFDWTRDCAWLTFFEMFPGLKADDVRSLYDEDFVLSQRRYFIQDEGWIL
ncbi:hypothetical protein DM02DRAFT_651474 [Periconia macrospinosa]|uniref:Uncharacterized protein n=1 Tax=Periconia macrospinosa TaxID=97972 RepID=A0A2V1E5B5_9PLEO|nr:hypothetical protein DM02DRAFT_651474 [Periconia macrospinosa]